MDINPTFGSNSRDDNPDLVILLPLSPDLRTGRDGAAVDEKRIHFMMKELEKALCRAVSDSSAASEAMHEIRSEGFSIYLVLDPDPRRRHRRKVDSSKPQRDAEPAFRLDGRDVAFLKSLGIDATRPARRRKGTS